MTTTLYESGIEALHSRRNDRPLVEIVADDPDFQTIALINKGQIDTSPEVANALDQRAIPKLSAVVRECIAYVPGARPWHSATEGDCYSFTFALDELGQQLGYERRVAFCNGHAFNFFISNRGALHMLHGETPHMQIADLASNDWASDMLMDSHYQAITNQEEDALRISLATDWLRFYSHAAQKGRRPVDLPWLNAHMPAMSVMLPQYGLPALGNYSRLQNALHKRDIHKTTEAFTKLANANPQAETRKKINDQMDRLERNVRIWARDNALPTETIVECLALFDASMPVKTKSLSVFMGDALRSVAHIRDDQELAELALAYYRTADRQGVNRNDQTLAAKMDRAQEAAAGYEPDSQQSRYVGRVAFSSLALT